MKTLRVVLAYAALSWGLAAGDTSSWQNLAALKPGQKIEIRAGGESISAEFVRFDAQSVTVRGKSGERSLAQSVVNRIALAKRSRGIWIGLAAGAAGGLVAGAALGSRLANESGGDFNNLKPAIAGGCAAAGALIGMGIGAAVRHGTVVYQR